MKAITDKKKLPRFLMVSPGVDKRMPTNKWLLEPYRDKEMVMVSDNQEPCKGTDHTTEQFRQRYVRIVRKNPFNGKWELTYVTSWSHLEPLTAKK